MGRVALLASSGGVKSPHSASIAGASGIHHGKQSVPVLRQPVPRALRQWAPRELLRPGLHWGGIFRREFGESPGHSRLMASIFPRCVLGFESRFTAAKLMKFAAKCAASGTFDDAQRCNRPAWPRSIRPRTSSSTASWRTSCASSIGRRRSDLERMSGESSARWLRCNSARKTQSYQVCSRAPPGRFLGPLFRRFTARP